jgi:hypothetical protein
VADEIVSCRRDGETRLRFETTRNILLAGACSWETFSLSNQPEDHLFAGIVPWILFMSIYIASSGVVCRRSYIFCIQEKSRHASFCETVSKVT